MKFRFLFVLFSGLVLAGIYSPVSAEISANDLIERVRVLTSGEYAGRGSGTAEGDAVAALLADWFREAELEPAFDGEYLQQFPLRGKGWTGNDLTGKFSYNVAGILPGAGELSERFLVVGAHHDHLGRLDPSMDGQGPAADLSYYAGANDNASGITVLIELLNQLKLDNSPSRRSILFVCFGGEEVGLQGSGYLVSHPPVPLEKMDTMINFDTVGQMTDNLLYVSGVATSNSFGSMVESANTEGLELSLARGGWSGSDHMSFNTHEVPVLFVFGGPYPEYNTPEDLWETINVEGLKKITVYSHRLIQNLRYFEGEFDWFMVAEKLRPDDGGTQNKNTWFGSLPDFTEDIQGYKLAGVFDGSPAAEAGLKKGDVLVKLAGREVTDLPTFTRALRSNEPGTLVEVTVLREGNSLNFTVVLGDRKNRGTTRK